MQERGLTIPELMLIAGNRVALGVGVGLLIGDKTSDRYAKGRWMGAAGNGRIHNSPYSRESTS